MGNSLKYIWFLTLLVLTLPYAFAEPVASPEFSYRLQKNSRLEQDISAVLTKYDELLFHHEMKPVFVPVKLADSKTSLETVDRIYSGDLGRTVVFIKGGVQPSINSLMDSTVKVADGYLTHIRHPSGLIVAIYIKSTSWDIAASLLVKLKEEKVSKNYLRPSFGLINSAYAEVDPSCEPEQKSEALKLALAGKDITNQSSPMDYLAGCTLSALKGVWNGSGGAITGATKSALELITSPVETGKKYWEGVNKLWDVTTTFFADFENEANKLYESFATLDHLTKTKLACEVIGTIGGGVLLTYLTMGAASSETVKIVALQIRKALQTALEATKFSGVKKTLVARLAWMKKSEIQVQKNLFKIERGSEIAAAKNNAEVLKKLDDLPVKVASSTRKAGLSNAEMRKLYQEIVDHPVAAVSRVDDYSKFSPGMGYCFGRATAVHIKAITSGLDKGSIRKVWALGDLQTGASSWRYHVTTVVRDTNGKWHAIDPVFGKVMTIEDWYKEMKRFDAEGNMRIVATEPQRLSPAYPQKYSRRGLSDPSFEGYFDDLMESFRKESSEVAAKRRAERTR